MRTARQEKRWQSARPPAPPAAVPADTGSDFPFLSRLVGGSPVAFLDNAASTQKPRCVIDAESDFYSNHYANVHRGAYRLSEEATRLYEEAREQVRHFIGARSAREIVFVRGATEGINLVAAGLGRGAIRRGDDVVVTWMEHHANLVPWQRLCQDTGAVLRAIAVQADGTLDVDQFARILDARTKLVALTHASNVLGTVNPVRQMAAMARTVGAQVLVDGAQAVPHVPVDVQGLGCDYYVFSGHKVYGPMGVGVLYGRQERLDALPPYQLGGEMIQTVRIGGATWREPPFRFEAGTPNAAGAVGLAEALRFLARQDRQAVAAREMTLARRARRLLAELPGVRVFGDAPETAPIVAFTLRGIHPHDVGTILDRQGVAVRTGHHCCQPLMERLGVAATVRASFALYNTEQDVDRLVAGVRIAVEKLS